MHDGGADLDGSGTESDELGRVPPGSDSANAGNRQADFGIGGARLHHVERDRFYRRPAVTTMRAATGDDGSGTKVSRFT